MSNCSVRMELNSHFDNDLHKIVDSRRDLLERSPGLGCVHKVETSISRSEFDLHHQIVYKNRKRKTVLKNKICLESS